MSDFLYPFRSMTCTNIDLVPTRRPYRLSPRTPRPRRKGRDSSRAPAPLPLPPLAFECRALRRESDRGSPTNRLRTGAHLRAFTPPRPRKSHVLQWHSTRSLAPFLASEKRRGSGKSQPPSGLGATGWLIGSHPLTRARHRDRVGCQQSPGSSSNKL